ncbi:GNAT family N-acetyltransferase [Streptomyces sp. 549]|uniref:GNAT family N-acetyltransferase n=1 Tax=Streptomyces sp. 549 TaxID=3049076 RepID=UPI0024C37DD6|nr:GNAT family N-acetyltransferase [Streptomyces sp. 549]MDK1476151.1 GNAT family N-acetyltransferase [Streptomyces sp. 549]
MTRRAELDLRQYGHADAAAIRPLLLDVHDEVYEGSGDPLAGREVFAEFVDHWSGREGFACVVGYDQGVPVGYAYGAPLGPDTAWWAEVNPPLPAEFTAESGARTFALSELMVRTPWRKTGAARSLHDALIGSRPEHRVTLLVQRAHSKVRALYEGWGYRTVGDVVPFEGAPDLCAMVLDR